eukprot:CAMPEP_0170599020 /NCGR_PEP_ID=MMETSP0224-20130122/16564_1 /TAXON_ID=285029 /ORGANISM="Togula jolla, Strain CCCM 725" /LENGTH=560 /DNA_ID=CAMNT_0010923623 /DNA_START=8 /DNA_END=1690 /DNA_ORIENTATION=+
MAEVKLVKVLQRCIGDVARHPVEHVDVYLGDDITTWHVALHYPDVAPFTGGSGASLRAGDFSLYVELRFTQDFPSRPPRLKFISPWMNHQHLWGDRICHSLLSDDFMEFFRERRVHGTSLWSAASALADGDGLGGMPRYLQVLREFLSSDPDYDEELKYDVDSLAADVATQRSFSPDWLSTSTRLEPATRNEEPDAKQHASPPEPDGASGPAGDWGADFFLKSPLVPGSVESHPCFDVAVGPGRVPSLSTTMTLLCRRSLELGARTTDFGTPISTVLPFPCSRRAWKDVGVGLAQSAMQELAPLAQNFYKLGLPSPAEDAAQLEAILGVVGELWKTTCIGIVRGEGHESERAMLCFVNLHFLLLFLTEEHPGLREHAAATARSFLEHIELQPEENLKAVVPDLGRFLVRFLLTEDKVPFRSHVSTIVRELFSRNVRWVDFDFWADSSSSEAQKQEEVQVNFEASQFGMKLTVFQSYYILRSAELGLDTLPALEACSGRPAPERLGAFQDDFRRIKEMSNFLEFFQWLQLDDLASLDIHGLLCDAVDEAEARGYNEGVRRD